MSGSLRAISLRPMLPSDTPVLAALFIASIEDLTADDYDANQRAAWSAFADDEVAFGTRLTELLTIVASSDGVAVGFAALKLPGTFEMLYVLPAAAGAGVGNALCDACEKLAKARGAKSLDVQSSDTAQGFFAKRGYEARQRGTVAMGDEWLGRTAMRKALEPQPEATSH